MSPIVLIVVVAVSAGLLAGGSLRPFEHLRVHWWALAPIGLALQGAPVPDLGNVDRDLVAAVMLLGSYGMLFGFTLLNRRLPGTVLVFAGLALNLAAIAPNGGMPVDPVAARMAGAGSITVQDDAKHHLLGPDDVLPFLADVIGVPPPARLVVSLGDVVLYAGVLMFVVTTMRGLAPANVRPPARRFQMYRGKHLPPERRGLPRRLLLPSPTPAAARWGTAR
jgi:Family of unknown function (DUF5317)